MLPKALKTAALFSAGLTAVFSIAFQCAQSGVYLTLAITFGTAAYHLGMRLLVGFLYDVRMKRQADYTKKWYRLQPWELRVYQFLRVKAWKRKMPTYYPADFSRKKHTWDEIAKAMCEAELVHETIVLLSFVPLIFSKWFGSFYVFLITSVCAAVFDLLFVIVQRYNRPRVLRLAAKAHAAADVSSLSAK